MSQSWTIGILCYNEEESIEGVVEDVVKLLQKISPKDYEILIVNDGSTDNTLQVLKLIESKYKSIVNIHHSENLGIGQAIISAHRNATKENICVISGDGETKVDEIIPFSNLDNNTFVSFYREENLTYNLRRNILSFLNKKFNKLFLGISLKDVNWTKIYKTKDVVNLELKSTSSLVESEICNNLIKKGLKVIEVKSEYLNRTGGVSNGATQKNINKVLKDVFILIISNF